MIFFYIFTDCPLGCIANSQNQVFLKRISKEECNDDGTIEAEEVLRLGLDNWLFLQTHQCYLCHREFSDRYDWRNHIQLEHEGCKIRFACNICHIKHFHKRTRLIDHIVSKHHPNLKYW